jgi:hypothetical protein
MPFSVQLLISIETTLPLSSLGRNRFAFIAFCTVSATTLISIIPYLRHKLLLIAFNADVIHYFCFLTFFIVFNK